MKTLKNAALVALCFALTGLTAMNADAGCRSKRGHSHRGGYKPYAYRPCYKPVRYAPPKKVAPPVVTIPTGATINVSGYFGKPGHVILALAGAELHAKVLAWTPKGVTVLIPPMALAAPAPGKLLVYGYDRRIRRTFAVKVVPAAKKPAPAIAVQPGGPKTPQGTPNPAAAPAGTPAQAQPAGPTRPAEDSQPATPTLEVVDPQAPPAGPATQTANAKELPDDLK